MPQRIVVPMSQVQAAPEPMGVDEQGRPFYDVDANGQLVYAAPTPSQPKAPSGVVPAPPSPLRAAYEALPDVPDVARAALKPLQAVEAVYDVLSPRRGVEQITQGVINTVKDVANPKAWANLGSDVIEGAMRVGAPLVLPALASSPVLTVGTLALAEGASMGAEAMAKRAGLSPEYQRLAANVAALTAVGAGGKRIVGKALRGLDATATKIGQDVGGFYARKVAAAEAAKPAGLEPPTMDATVVRGGRYQSPLGEAVRNTAPIVPMETSPVQMRPVNPFEMPASSLPVPRALPSRPNVRGLLPRTTSVPLPPSSLAPPPGQLALPPAQEPSAYDQSLYEAGKAAFEARQSEVAPPEPVDMEAVPQNAPEGPFDPQIVDETAPISAPTGVSAGLEVPGETMAGTDPAGMAMEPWQVPLSELVIWRRTLPRSNTPVEDDSDMTEGAIEARSRRYRNAQTDPSTFEAYPVGTYGLDSTGELMQLREYAIDDPTLVFAEGKTRNATTEKYAAWIRAGHEPPPMEGIETENGQIKIQDGHHRRSAIEDAGGKTIRVWVSLTRNVPIGTDAQGRTITLPKGVKHADIVREAVESGREVPPEVLAEYPDLAQPVVADAAQTPPPPVPVPPQEPVAVAPPVPEPSLAAKGKAAFDANQVGRVSLAEQGRDAFNARRAGTDATGSESGEDPGASDAANPAGKRSIGAPRSRAARQSLRDRQTLGDMARESARDAGFQGTNAELDAIIDEEVSFLEDLVNEQIGWENEFSVLEEIARNGGIGDDKGDPGEIKMLREDSKSLRVPKSRTKNWRFKKSTFGQAGELYGVPGVLRRGGMTLDYMREAVSQHPYWANRLITVNDLLDAIEAEGVSRTKRGLRPGFLNHPLVQDRFKNGEWLKSYQPASTPEEAVFGLTDEDFAALSADAPNEPGGTADDELEPGRVVQTALGDEPMLPGDMEGLATRLNEQPILPDRAEVLAMIDAQQAQLNATQKAYLNARSGGDRVALAERMDGLKRGLAELRALVGLLPDGSLPIANETLFDR